MKTIKSNPSKIIKSYVTDSKKLIGIVSENYSKIIKINEIAIMDKASNGSYIIKDKIIDSFLVANLADKSNKEDSNKERLLNTNSNISLKEIDDKLFDIDNIIGEISNE